MAAIQVRTLDGSLHTLEVAATDSWAETASRWAGGPVVAEDLAADPPRFTAASAWQTTLRPSTPGDLPDLVRWRQEPHVERWWVADGPPTRERVEGLYLPEIRGESATKLWIIEANGRSIGFVQDYLLSDHPDYAVLTPDPNAVGFDYAIGEPGWVGRGVGRAALWSWIHHARARHPEVATAFAAPDHRNAASLRVLAAVGFRAGTWFDEPQPDGSIDTVVGCSLDFAEVVG